TEIPLLPEVLASRGRVADAVRVAQAWAERQTRGGHVQATALAKLELADLLLREGRSQATLREATAVDSLARSLTLTDERIRAGGQVRPAPAWTPPCCAPAAARRQRGPWRRPMPPGPPRRSIAPHYSGAWARARRWWTTS